MLVKEVSSSYSCMLEVNGGLTIWLIPVIFTLTYIQIYVDQKA
jgi:hypothetical protein